jgi:hypothetical protein
MLNLRFVLLFGAALAVANAGTILDNFNRPNAPTLGPNWTQQAGTDQILNNQATAITDTSLATYNGVSSNSAFVSAYDNGTGVQYIALVLDYNAGQDFFIKVQNNGGASGFNYYAFYTGNNGGGLFSPLSSTFSSALIWATASGTSATLYIDPTFTGVAQQTYTYDFGINTGGSGIGLGFYGAAAADNFGEGIPGGGGVPEPGTFWLLSSALAGAAVFVKLRRPVRR